MNKKIISLFIVIFTILNATHQADVVVNKLDGISAGNLVYSGFLPISDSSSDQLFFTYYGAKDAKQQQDLQNYPLVVVLGAPGTSAQYLNLAGMGPVILRPDMTTTQNPNTVTNYANVMFVDLTGTGFSFVPNTSSIPSKSEDYGAQLTYAVNALAKQSALGKSKISVLVGQGTFLRSIPGLDDIASLSGIVHISAWPQMYAVSRYYGVAGIQLKIFGSSQRVAIQSTLISCYNYIVAKKYVQGHNCYESLLNFVQSKTKNANLFNVQLGSNLTEHLAMIQYYFSQSSVVSSFKAPAARLYETQSNWIANKTWSDLAVNKTSNLSQYMKDYLTVKHWYVSGDSDYIAYKSSLRYWLQNQLSFVQSSAFKAAKLQDIIIDGKTVGYGKGVKQLKYTQLIGCGHFVVNDQTAVFNSLMKDWVSSLSQKINHITQEKSQIKVSEY